MLYYDFMTPGIGCRFRPLIRDCIPPILHLGRIFAAVFRTIFTFYLHMSDFFSNFAAEL
jgi:hypothetical protein